ncbi:hypothetical protein HOLDEFILI_01310 [Holdemania filiformis DSM 12042]|uniref:Uncharacterized protein n=1 Tax=Holdemania filiformis DSM 12042 TaxID=545696 RepID=B9Y679_9FIRM|nr:hypothetical protein HOLDEFILI_01310 [Holdemania filiformis DSM 12042]
MAYCEISFVISVHFLKISITEFDGKIVKITKNKRILFQKIIRNAKDAGNS